MKIPPITGRPGRRCSAVLVVLALAGCSGGGTLRAGDSVVLRLGHAPNLTHAVALAGLETGRLARALGPGVRLEPKVFNAGPSAVQALFAGSLDAAFVGPSPAINAHLRSRGEAIRIVSGATSGGSFLVVREGIRTAAQLRGARLSTPQLGNTQDVSLRHWLGRQRLRVSLEGGGDVSIIPQENAQTLDTFRSGSIDGAWVPEPWAARLVEAGGRVLVDESSEWPGGRFATTVLVVRAQFLRENPGIVRDLVAGTVNTIEWLDRAGPRARDLVNEALGEIVGKPLPPAVLATAWSHLTFTADPVADSLEAMARRARTFGLLPGVRSGLDGAFDLGPLNEILRERGRPEVRA